MFKRDLLTEIQHAAKEYPVVTITGPRQSGKTTLARTLFKKKPYVSFENIDIRMQAQADSRSFLANYAEGAIFDEVQHVPELLSYLQNIVDDAPHKGRYVITGSQNFSLSAHIAQSLSGRVGMLTLLPLSLHELTKPPKENNPYVRIFQGGYPALHQMKMHPLDFYPSYIQTYLERDVRQIKNIEDLGRFHTFLKLCAGRVGQLVNFSSLAQDCGISHTTARHWLSVLEASYIIFFLQPFHKNFNKRMIKMPKIYFYDTGLVCTLLGLEKSSQLETHYLKGGLYENSVILELLKSRLNQGLPPHLYFWRDQTGHEVDCIAEWGGSLHAIEIKSNATFHPDFIKDIRYFCELAQEKTQSYVVYNGPNAHTFQNTKLVPFRDIHTKLR